jgi:hypothetical protein
MLMSLTKKNLSFIMGQIVATETVITSSFVRIVSILEKDIRVRSTHMTAQFEQHRTTIDNLEKLTLT